MKKYVAVGGACRIGDDDVFCAVYRQIKPTDRLKDCLACGLCCKLDGIQITNPDTCAVAEEHREQDASGKIFVKNTPTGYCPYHDITTHKCMIYDQERPTACGAFVHGAHPLCYEQS